MFQEWELPQCVPGFQRIWDFVGLWAILPERLDVLREQVASMHWPTHVQAYSAQMQARGPSTTGAEMLSLGAGKKVAVVKLTGVLSKGDSSLGGTSTIRARREIRQAATDPEVGGILLAIDSGGGTVAGADDLAMDIRNAGTVKPVWAHIDDCGCSAAYWAASQASRITINSPTALTGSIGTLQVVHDFSGAAEKQGVKVHVFGTGPLKGMGTHGAKLTDQQQAHIQQLVDAVQVSFDNAVLSGRKLSAQQLAAVRHGGAMTATDALKYKLVDAIQPLGGTIAEMSSKVPMSAGMVRTDQFGKRLGTLPMLKPNPN